MSLLTSRRPQAAGLARLHEDKQQDLLRLNRPRPPWTTPTSSRPPPAAPSPTVAIAPGILPTPALPVPNRPRFCHLSAAEIVERREKGLCFNCDQRFSRNNNCRARFSLLVAKEDDPVVEGDIATSDQDLAWATALDEAQLSLHVMSGIQAAQTFRVT
ncbi:hypothetical protein A2U01_0041295, partial [Trifolium medium]|nr:hypothetical protein [Trifolium medium]